MFVVNTSKWYIFLWYRISHKWNISLNTFAKASAWLDEVHAIRMTSKLVSRKYLQVFNWQWCSWCPGNSLALLTSHYLNQRWHSPMTYVCVIRPWFDDLLHRNEFRWISENSCVHTLQNMYMFGLLCICVGLDLPICWDGFNSIPACISNHMPKKVWDEIT